MKASTLESLAFCLILGVGVCADSLAETPTGMAVFLGGVALSSILIHAAHPKVHNRERDRTKAHSTYKCAPAVPPPLPNETPLREQKKSRCGGRTPQRQGKTDTQIYFTPLFYRGKRRMSN